MYRYNMFHASARCRVHYVAYFTILHCVLYPSVKYTHSNPNYVLVIRDAYVRDITRAARVIQK